MLDPPIFFSLHSHHFSFIIGAHLTLCFPYTYTCTIVPCSILKMNNEKRLYGLAMAKLNFLFTSMWVILHFPIVGLTIAYDGRQSDFQHTIHSRQPQTKSEGGRERDEMEVARVEGKNMKNNHLPYSFFLLILLSF